MNNIETAVGKNNLLVFKPPNSKGAIQVSGAIIFEVITSNLSFD
jgi:hypothetical protein